MTEPMEARQPSGAAPFAIGDALSYGWKAFWANIGPLALVAVVVVGVNLFFSVFANTTSSTGGRLLIQILGRLASTLIELAWIRAGLAITAGQRPELPELFRIDRTFGIYLVASILFTIMAVIGFILLIIPGIIVVLVFGFYGWAIADRELGVMDSFSRSAEITRGNRLRKEPPDC